MRRLLQLLAALGLGAGTWLAAVPPVAAIDAATIDDVGWWARTNQPPAMPGALLSPDVTAGQLLVEGTPEGATAIAALRATLPEGTGDPVLTLRATSAAGAETAILLVCQSGSGWTGAHAGAWDAKPSPDCSASVQGVPSEDGTEWTFALGALQFGDKIDVVLTPGLVPESDGQLSSPFRVVFDRPETDAIAVSEGAAPPPDIPTPSFGGGPSAVPGASPSPPSITTGGSPSFSLPTPPTATDLARQPVQAALPPEEQGATATAPALVEQPIAAALPSSSSDGRVLGVLVVLGAGALLWWSSQQPVPEHRVLSRFATAAPGASQSAAAPEPTMGGLGRFRRERSGRARPVG